MRKTKLLNYIYNMKRPHICLVDNEYFCRQSQADAYKLDFEESLGAVRCYDWADNHRLIAYAQDDSDLNAFQMEISNVTDRIDAVSFYEFYDTKKHARQRLEERREDLDVFTYRRLKADLRAPI